MHTNLFKEKIYNVDLGEYIYNIWYETQTASINIINVHKETFDSMDIPDIESIKPLFYIKADLYYTGQYETYPVIYENNVYIIHLEHFNDISYFKKDSFRYHIDYTNNNLKFIDGL